MKFLAILTVLALATVVSAGNYYAPQQQLQRAPQGGCSCDQPPAPTTPTQTFAPQLAPQMTYADQAPVQREVLVQRDVPQYYAPVQRQILVQRDVAHGYYAQQRTLQRQILVQREVFRGRPRPRPRPGVALDVVPAVAVATPAINVQVDASRRSLFPLFRR